MINQVIGFHMYNMILKGISIKGEDPFYNDMKDVRKQRYKRFDFKIDERYYDTFQEKQDNTPYTYINETRQLLFKGEEINKWKKLKDTIII